MVLLAVPARDREVQQREDHSTLENSGWDHLHRSGRSIIAASLGSKYLCYSQALECIQIIFKNKLRKIEKLHPGKGKQLKRVPFIFQTTSFFGFHANFSKEYFRGSKHFPIQTVDARGTALAIAGKIQAGAAERSRDWRPPTLTSFDLTKSYH